MDEAKRQELLDRIVGVVGNEAFNRLVTSVKEVKWDKRLRFWQEALLTQAGVSIADSAQFLELFGGAKLRDIGRPKDPLTAATIAILKPAVDELGFKTDGSRSFARVRDDVLQGFSLQLSAWGSKDFAVNYYAFTLVSPREHFVSLAGGRLPRGKSRDGWWASKNHQRADESMREVVGGLTTFCFPWFVRTSTTAGLLDVLLEEHAEKRSPDAHYLFEIACCLVHLGRTAEAQSVLSEAVAAFRKSHQEHSVRTWCLVGLERCELLQTAIRESTQVQLLAKWREDSIRNLKLEKIL